MRKRNTQLRRHEIVNLVVEKGEVSVEELALTFETSEVTIRKDLTALESSGQLLRRHGGAILLPKEVTDSIATEVASKQKEALAKTALTLIQDYNRIVIDYGTTTGALIPLLGNKRGLVVMTNSLALANSINDLENEPTLIMTGGTWDTNSESFQGKVAESVLRSYDFDQLFIGADGLDLERGTTTFNELTGLSQVMAEVSREVIVMIESEKIHRKMPNLELGWEGIDILVTDDHLSDQDMATIKSKGVRVMRAHY
ncbi:MULTISPECIES: DeoR/GlpR family DNA-binding transcription regulator [Vibrio]|uniref:DeoR family transcriptional regulator n=1 Tax=Vibrio algicola TaxID=2662262 RepID=A0A5Q0TEQ8_9VIBR|nr:MULTISPECIES: DeoR family transcriptional regulator [Vibrio]MBD1575279.1 DeoR family transcriptional regulator [Vibrio sp. S11_S32]